jgi:SAM-dependent methyltransferase
MFDNHSERLSTTALFDAILMNMDEHGHQGEQDPAQEWERRYAEQGHIWSGHPNAALVDVVSTLDPGSALDLGCGEGGDSLWLAEHGWAVTAVDISPTAVERGTALSTERRIPEGTITWLVEDLESWRPTREYDLVSACFFQSFVDLNRTDILQRAARAVGPGGHLLLVSHAEAPPWALGHQHQHQHHRFLSPTEELEALQIEDSTWTTVISDLRSRHATGPDGQTATIRDSVLLIQRR